MNQFPEQLYAPGNLAQSRIIDPQFLRGTVSIANVQAGPLTVYTVPIDHAFLLASLTCIADPGAAQGVSAISIWLRHPNEATQERVIIEEWSAVVANLTRSMNWSGSLLVPGGWLIQAQGIFDAGGVANAITAYALGVLIPRGNIERA